MTNRNGIQDDPAGDETRCPLCERRVAPGAGSRHHLVPRLKGGKNGPTVLLCSSCHSKIHNVLTEAELARDYNTLEKLRSHPELARFAQWVSGRDGHFGSRSLRKKKRP